MKINPKDIEELERNTQKELELTTIEELLEKHPQLKAEALRVLGIEKICDIPPAKISMVRRRVKECIKFLEKTKEKNED